MSEALARATITLVDRQGTGQQARDSDLQEISLDFNPETLTIKVTNATEKKKKKTNQQVQYTGSSFASLSFDAIFDSTRPRARAATGDESGASSGGGTADAAAGPEALDVRSRTRVLAGLLDGLDPNNQSTANRRMLYPKLVRFQWGSVTFQGYVESYQEVLDYFSPDGVPLRAKVSVTLTEQSHRYHITGDDRRDDSQSPTSTAGDGATAASGATGGDPAGAGGPEDASPGGLSAALSALGQGMAKVGAIAGQNGLDSLFELSAGIDLSFDLALDLGLSVELQADLDLGLGVDLSASASAGVDLSAGASVDVFGGAAIQAAVGVDADLSAGSATRASKTTASAVPRSAWAPDGPTPGSATAALAAAVVQTRAVGAERAASPGAGAYSSTSTAGPPASAAGGRAVPLPIKGSPPRPSPLLGAPPTRALFDRHPPPIGVGAAVDPGRPLGRPRWEGSTAPAAAGEPAPAGGRSAGRSQAPCGCTGRKR